MCCCFSSSTLGRLARVLSTASAALACCKASAAAEPAIFACYRRGSTASHAAVVDFVLNNLSACAADGRVYPNPFVQLWISYLSLSQNEEDVLACGKARGGGGVENGAARNTSRRVTREPETASVCWSDPFRTGKPGYFLRYGSPSRIVTDVLGLPLVWSNE